MGFVGKFVQRFVQRTLCKNLVVFCEGCFRDNQEVFSTASLKLSLTRRSLSRFTQVVIPAFELSPCHKWMIEYLEDLLAGKIKKLAIISQPQYSARTAAAGTPGFDLVTVF